MTGVNRCSDNWHHMNTSTVWVFCGVQSPLPSGIFSTQEEANAWIQTRLLSGTLTEYPVGISAYDWAVKKGYFSPQKPAHTQPQFIQSFSSATQKHFHYENGIKQA